MVVRFGAELDGVEEHKEGVGVGNGGEGEEAGDRAVVEVEVRKAVKNRRGTIEGEEEGESDTRGDAGLGVGA